VKVWVLAILVLDYHLEFVVVYVTHVEMYPYSDMLDIVAKMKIVIVLVIYFHFAHHQMMFEFVLLLDLFFVNDDDDDDDDDVFYD
jgi:hypothetical protein